MRSLDLHNVARGLAVVQWGFRLVAYTIVSVAAFRVLTALPGWDRSVHDTVNWIAAALIAAGTLVAFIGRCVCLATPGELPAARAHIWLAVILEWCGLVGGTVDWSVNYWAGSLPDDVPTVGVALAVPCVLVGKGVFLLYARELANAVGHWAPARIPLEVTLLLVAFSAMIAVSHVALVFGGGGGTPLGVSMCMTGFAFCWMVAGAFGLYLYGRMLRRLREAVAAYNTLGGERVKSRRDDGE